MEDVGEQSFVAKMAESPTAPAPKIAICEEGGGRAMFLITEMLARLPAWPVSRIAFCSRETPPKSADTDIRTAQPEQMTQSRSIPVPSEILVQHRAFLSSSQARSIYRLKNTTTLANSNNRRPSMTWRPRIVSLCRRSDAAAKSVDTEKPPSKRRIRGEGVDLE